MDHSQAVEVLKDLLERKEARLSSWLLPNKSIAQESDILAIKKEISALTYFLSVLDRTEAGKMFKVLNEKEFITEMGRANALQTYLRNE